ncbi:MAG: sulfatase-like hydrolase/transferase [Planctomycetota bacterium]
MRRPNILVFFVDQQRWDTCGCYGQSLPLTPNLDAMATAGTRFSHAFTCQPVCGPARAAIQTGRYASEVGCDVNHTRLPPDAPTIATLLGDAGYDTGYIGKWHLASCGPLGGPDDFRTRPVPPALRGGYDHWLAADVLEFTSHSYDGHMFDDAGERREFPPGRYRADAQTDWVLEYLDTRVEAERPFFLMASYIEPHHQNDHEHYEGPHGSRERFADFAPPGDLIGHDGDWREEYPDYLGCVHALDANLGRVRARLAETGLDRDTVVIYTSDHGSHFRTRNDEYKRSCHDGCLRIPLVACGPGFAQGGERAELASLIDLPATVVRAAGLEQPTTFRGRALQDAVTGSAQDWPDCCFAEISESHIGRCIRTAHHTYEVSLAPDGRPHWQETFLYDNTVDPHQQNNLVAEPLLVALRAELWDRLRTWMRSTGEIDPVLVEA